MFLENAKVIDASVRNGAECAVTSDDIVDIVDFGHGGVVLLSSSRRKIDARRSAGDQSGRVASQCKRKRCNMFRWHRGRLFTPGRAFSLPPSLRHPPSSSYPRSLALSLLELARADKTESTFAAIFRTECHQHRNSQVSKSS